MPLNDNAVITAAIGYVYTAAVGTVAPTPSQLASADPATFGAQTQTLTVSGTPTGGTFTVKVGTGTPSAPIAFNATADQVQAAIEGLAEVGLGNTAVSGTSVLGSPGVDVSLIGELQGQALTFTTTATFTGGTTPTAAFTVKTAVNGWSQIGHTSRDKMPEFAYKGGEYNLKGTWQRKRLRLVQDKDIPADTVSIQLEQWDREAMELYFGADAAAGVDGVFGVDGNFVPLEEALLMLIVDGPTTIGFYSPKAAITRDEKIDLPLDDFVALPIKATFLNLGTRRLYDWISEELFPVAP
jgi:hypothetical protein